MAKRLEAAGGLLLDNHHFYDFVKPFVGPIVKMDSAEKGRYFDEMGKLQSCFFDFLGKFYPKDEKVVYVLTLVMLQGIENGLENRLENIKKLVADIDADFIPIQLLGSPEVLKNRCQTESRKARGKLVNPERMDVLLKQYKPLQFDHPNKLVIDVSNLDEEETFGIIKKHLAKFENQPVLESLKTFNQSVR